MNALKKPETKTTKPRTSLELLKIERTKRTGFLERWLKFFKPTDFLHKDWEKLELRNHAPSRSDDPYQPCIAYKHGGL